MNIYNAEDKLERLNKSIKEEEKLYKAICEDDLTYLRKIRDSGFDFNKELYIKQHLSCLTIAIKKGSLLTVKELLKPSYHIDVNKSNELGTLNPILIAISCKDIEKLKLLIQCGANVNIKNDFGLTPLIFAIKITSENCRHDSLEAQKELENQKEIINLLLNNGAKKTINNGITDSYGLRKGSTALMFASRYGNKMAVEILLNNGAQINNENFEGNNAFIMAVEKDYLDVVKLFLKHGVNPNNSNKKGKTALMVSSELLTTKVLRFLLTLDNIDVNLSDNTGLTPLMIASKSGNCFILQRLLETGADVTLKNKEGKTALDFAKLSEFSEDKNFVDCINTLNNEITKIKLKNNLDNSLNLKNKTLKIPKII